LTNLLFKGIVAVVLLLVFLNLLESFHQLLFLVVELVELTLLVFELGLAQPVSDVGQLQL